MIQNGRGGLQSASSITNGSCQSLPLPPMDETCPISSSSIEKKNLKIEFHIGDCLLLFPAIPDGSVDMIFADPPYNLDKQYYSVSDKNGNYFQWMEEWIRECYRVLRPGGSAYFMNAPKNFGEQERVIRKVGFKIISYIIWMRRNPAPAKNVFPNIHSDIHFCEKPGGKKYFSSGEIIRYELRRADNLIGKDHRPYDVWIDIPKLVPGFMAQSEVVLKEGTTAMVLPNQLPEKLVRRCILASTKPGDLVLDPFLGVGTSMRAAGKEKRSFIGFEINEKYRAILDEQRKQLKAYLKSSKLFFD